MSFIFLLNESDIALCYLYSWEAFALVSSQIGNLSWGEGNFSEANL